MGTVNKIATFLIVGGLGVASGHLLFSAGTLTTLGWFVALPLFVGSTTKAICIVYDVCAGPIASMTAKAKEAINNQAEMHGKKPDAQTA